MKFLVLLAVAVVCVSADVSHLESKFAPILKDSFDLSPEGGYQYVYETGNGIYAQASGVVTNQNSEYPSLEVSGSYKYTAPDGTPVELSYTAGENGYVPVGSHLPVAPPIPEAIARSLEYIAAHPPAVESAAKVSAPTAYKRFR